MTREEAIEIFEQKGWWIAQKETFTSKQAEEIIKLNDAVNFALTALRPVSREQVEKVWRGEWIAKHYVDGILEGTNFDECSKCGYQRVFENPELKTKYMFCPGCGRAMWDEAVQMVMERLEALKDEN